MIKLIVAVVAIATFQMIAAMPSDAEIARPPGPLQKIAANVEQMMENLHNETERIEHKIHEDVLKVKTAIRSHHEELRNTLQNDRQKFRETVLSMRESMRKSILDRKNQIRQDINQVIKEAVADGQNLVDVLIRPIKKAKRAQAGNALLNTVYNMSKM